jgi:hypothetical protein
MRFLTTALLLVLVALGSAASAAPTPVPGGSNQADAAAGGFGKPLFNGEVRLIPRELRDATAADGLTTTSDKKWIVFTATASNGAKRVLDMQQFTASVADASGDEETAQPDKLKPVGGVFGIPPGGSWREQIAFLVPAAFVPTKIVLLPFDRKHKGFRITVKPTDYKPA